MEYQLKEIVEACKGGDKSALEELLDRVKPLIIKTAKLIGVNANGMEDMIQEGYVAVLESIDEYDPGRYVPYLGYLKSRMYYAMLDAARKGEKYRNVLSFDEEVCEGVRLTDIIKDMSPGVEEIAETKDDYKKLHEAVDMLPKRQRMVIAERFFKDRTLTQVSQSMGIKYYTAAKLQERGIKKLKDILGKAQKVKIGV